MQTDVPTSLGKIESAQVGVPEWAFSVWARPHNSTRGETDMLSKFTRDEHGQDLIEYTLLLAFVALAAAALFISASSSISTIWSNASSKLSRAAS